MDWGHPTRPAERRIGRGHEADRAPATQPVRKGRYLLWSVPVGLQLSLIYALLLTAVLALLGWALYAQLDNFLVQNTAERLQTFTRPTLLRGFPPRGERGMPNPAARESYQEQVAASLVHELNRSDLAVVVLDSQGNIIDSTQSSSGDQGRVPPLPEDWADKIRAGLVTQPVKWVATSPGSVRQLIVLTPITVRSRDAFPELRLFLQQVTSLEAADAVLDQLRLYILLGIVAGTTIGVVAGLALTRAVLHPLDRMVRTAEAIAAGDLDRRLHLPPGSNEVARLGSAFDHMVDRLGAALEAQRRFVADASHELRTPLTSMEGLSEMLLIGADRGDTGVVQRTVRSIHGELGRLGRLVADLLTLSRLDSIVPMRLVSLDARKLISDAAEQMKPLAEAKRVSLSLTGEGQALIEGEPDRLKQVVLNLVDNAIRYTPEGGAVTLSAATDPATGKVRIGVRDTGPGIAPQHLPHIFDRFYRGDTSRARATGNTGLGLAIAQAIVQAHGGTIEVRSTPGSGASFEITLPARQKGVQLPPATPHRTKARSQQATPRG